MSNSSSSSSSSPSSSPIIKRIDNDNDDDDDIKNKVDEYVIKEEAQNGCDKSKYDDFEYWTRSLTSLPTLIPDDEVKSETGDEDKPTKLGPIDDERKTSTISINNDSNHDNCTDSKNNNNDNNNTYETTTTTKTKSTINLSGNYYYSRKYNSSYESTTSSHVYSVGIYLSSYFIIFHSIRDFFDSIFFDACNSI